MDLSSRHKNRRKSRETVRRIREMDERKEGAPTKPSAEAEQKAREILAKGAAERFDIHWGALTPENRKTWFKIADAQLAALAANGKVIVPEKLTEEQVERVAERNLIWWSPGWTLVLDEVWAALLKEARKPLPAPPTGGE